MDLVTRPQQLSNAEVLEQLARSGVLDDCRIWSGEGALSGRIAIKGHVLRLRIFLPPAFPLCLPIIVVEDCSPPRLIPHVLDHGLVCYESETEVLLDRHDPWGVVSESVRRALETLRQGLGEEGTKELVRELGVYWGGMAPRTIDCMVTAGDHPASLVALYNGPRLQAVADDTRVYGRFLPTRSNAGLRSEHAVYIPLDPVVVDPGFGPARLMRPAALRKYIRALPDMDRSMLATLLARAGGPLQLVVLGIRRPEGERALLGAWIERIAGGHPFLDEKAIGQIIPIGLERRDYGFLAPRGGANADLSSRRVLVAGCGSVGGHIAFALARAGVGNLALLDDDVFRWENTYRHVCGMAWIGQYKVEGLKKELERQLPYVTVTPHRARLEAVLRAKPNVIYGQDLVISALGNPTVELELNERAWSSAPRPPMIFAWVEPFGLGGHVLLTRPGGPVGSSRGCLQCLFTRSIEGSPLENRAAFAAPGVRYTRDVAGCGSRYLPFADLDAERTAEVSARLAIRVLRGEVRESPILSWKGESRAFEQAGYAVSPRYALSPGGLEDSRLAYIRDDCPVCAK